MTTNSTFLKVGSKIFTKVKNVQNDDDLILRSRYIKNKEWIQQQVQTWSNFN